MNKVLKFGLYFGVAASLASCGTSEHFMQDDVYNTRTPLMPPGTDLNDVTDYATFVAKKEQSEAQEQTTYVSPRQYNDIFYNSQFAYYGYSPYAPVTGISYFGYGNYYHPGYGYYGNSVGVMYPYGYSSAYYGNPYMIGYGQSFNGNTSWYQPISKPNTSKNLANSHAGTSAGRMGSTTSGGVVNYENKQIAKPTTSGYSGVGRNTMVKSSPVAAPASSNGRNTGFQERSTVRPVTAGRPATSGATATQRSSSNNTRTMESTPSTGSTRTYTNSSSVRTSTPSTIRSSSGSGGSGGGSVSTPSSGGGSRSGGRR